MSRKHVLVVQPVIAHYRVPLFDRLARSQRFAIQVQASPTVPGAPSTVSDLPDWGDATHTCVRLPGPCFWQTDLRLPADFGPGDVLVITGNPRFLSNFPLLRKARRRGVGIVWWGHGWSPTSASWRAAIRYRLMQVADVILLYTDEEVRNLPNRRLAQRCVGLNNSLDPTPINAAKAEWNAERLARFALEHNLAGEKLIVFCGRLKATPDTELDVLLRGLSRLKSTETGRRLRLVVIGDGSEEPRFRHSAQDLGVADRVLFQGAIYAERDLAPWFLLASCFVFPGAIGLSLIHAFHYGLPAITHGERRLHNPEIAALVDEENGLLFKRGSDVDLARQLTRIISDSNFQAQLSAAASRTVQEDYSFENMIARFEKAMELASASSLRRQLSESPR